MNQTNLFSTGEVFEKAGLPQIQISYWNNVQAEYNKLGFVFIEYALGSHNEFIWRCYLEYQTSFRIRYKRQETKI